MDVQSVVDGMMKLGLTKEQALGVIALLAQPAATTPAPGPEGPTVLTYYTEPFKDWGTPGTWHSDVTGHVIDFPHGQIDGKAWEGIAAYALRVSRQCHCEHPEGTISSIAASIKYPDGTPLTSDQVQSRCVPDPGAAGRGEGQAPTVEQPAAGLRHAGEAEGVAGRAPRGDAPVNRQDWAALGTSTWERVHVWSGVHPTATVGVLCFVVGFVLAKLF